MNCPEQDRAKPGDTIEITYEGHLSCGKQFIVVPVPPNIDTRLVEAGDIWIMESGFATFVAFDFYKIVKKSETKQDTKSVDASLRKQMDDNLSSVFD